MEVSGINIPYYYQEIESIDGQPANAVLTSEPPVKTPEIPKPSAEVVSAELDELVERGERLRCGVAHQDRRRPRGY